MAGWYITHNSLWRFCNIDDDDQTGLVPNEDMGTVFIDVRTSPGNSVQETRKVMEQVDSCLRTIPQVELYSNTTGNSMLSVRELATVCLLSD